MSFITSQHHQAFENFWVSNTGVVQVGAKADALAPQSIGFYKVEANCSTDENLSISMPNIKKTKRLKIKMGKVQAPDNFETLRQNSRPLETHAFTAKDIVSFTGVKTEVPNRGNWRQHKIALGYDGFDAKKSLNKILDAKPVIFTFILQGDPIQRYFGQNQVEYEFAVDKGLCHGECDCFDACGKVDCKILVEGLKKAMQLPIPRVLSTGAVVSRPITDFIKLDTITKCTNTTPAAAPVTVQYKKYEISICDDGATTLGLLSGAYPGKRITQTKREDSVTTYEFWQPAADAAPADFVIQKHVLPICGSCPTCPESYTSLAGVKNIEVRVACGAAAPVVPGAILTSLITSSLTGGDAYIVSVPTTTTDAAIDTALTGCVDYTVLGEVGASCLGTDATFSWTTCEECGKASKEYMIILTDNDCPVGDHLTELQAKYPDLVIALDQTGSCIHSYKATVLSDCVTPDLACGVDDNTAYSFQAPAPFKGKQWENKVTVQLEPNCDVTATPEDCCVCGIIVEGKAFHKDTLKECSPGILEYNPGDILGVKVHVTAYTYDPTDNPCNVTAEYVTTLQEEKLPRVTPGSMVQKYERARLAYEHKFYSGNVYLDEFNGFSLVAKPKYYYDHYRLVLRGKLNADVNRLMDGVDDIAYNFYFKEGMGKSFEAHINSLVLSAGNPDVHAVIL